MITRPDEYGHQNEDLAFTDSDRVRGGRRVVPDRAALYALTAKADQLKPDTTIVRIKADSEYDGATTEVLLVDAASIGSAAGWQVRSAVAAAVPTRPAAKVFTNEVLVEVPYTGAYPPLSQVFDAAGALIFCDLRADLAAKLLIFEFSEPTSGFIIF